MIEYLDVLDAKGNFTGITKPKDDVHRDGDWHKTAYVFFVNSKNQILLQKRSLKNKMGAGMWDISVGGHVSAGQTGAEAAIRETQEEIGVDIQTPDLNFLGMITYEGNSGQNQRFHRVHHESFVVHKDLDVSTLKLQASEVDEVKWVDLDVFKKWVEEKKSDLVQHPEVYRQLFEYLDRK